MRTLTRAYVYAVCGCEEPRVSHWRARLVAQCMWRAEDQHSINLGIGVYWDDHDRWRAPLVLRKTLHF
jgi:hypothetical protein